MISQMMLRQFTSVFRNNTRLVATAIKPLEKENENDFILVEEIGDKAVLTINRPKALNAANTEMVRKIRTYIGECQNRKSMILIKGAGGKAFCAGGDIREITKGSPQVGREFFGNKYAKNYLIGTLKIPYVAFIDGIVMGGGVGLSVHGRYRIATEKTLFAMPETSIGLFPDVGSSYFLPRLQGKLGYYLGLTGYRLKGQDVLHAGIATHYCESSKVPKVEIALLSLKNSSDVEGVINDFCTKPKSEFVLAKYLDQINKSFEAPTVEEILSSLEKDNSDWAKQTIKTLRTVSPLSLKITLHELHLGEKFSLGESLQMEYLLAVHCREDSDFREGVRALLIDRDNNPRWNPSRIEDVTEERVLSFFQPLPNNEDLDINVTLTRKL